MIICESLKLVVNDKLHEQDERRSNAVMLPCNYGGRDASQLSDIVSRASYGVTSKDPRVYPTMILAQLQPD